MRAFAFFDVIVLCSVAVAAASPPQSTLLIGQQAPQPDRNQSALSNAESTDTQAHDSQTTQAASSQTTSADSSKVTLTRDQISAILNYIAAQAPSVELKLELLGFDPAKPQQAQDLFGKPYSAQRGKSLGLTLGDDTWQCVKKTISNAVPVNATAVPSTNLPSSDDSTSAQKFVPEVGFRAQIPYGAYGAYLPGQYVMLMSFECKSLQLYFEGRLVGSCPIQDNGNLKTLQDILLSPSSQQCWFVNSAMPTESR